MCYPKRNMIDTYCGNCEYHVDVPTAVELVSTESSPYDTVERVMRSNNDYTGVIDGTGTFTLVRCVESATVFTLAITGRDMLKMLPVQSDRVADVRIWLKACYGVTSRG